MVSNPFPAERGLKFGRSGAAALRSSLNLKGIGIGTIMPFFRLVRYWLSRPTFNLQRAGEQLLLLEEKARPD